MMGRTEVHHSPEVTMILKEGQEGMVLGRRPFLTVSRL